jgi:hypothetical protein
MEICKCQKDPKRYEKEQKEQIEHIRQKDFSYSAERQRVHDQELQYSKKVNDARHESGI